MKFSFRWQWIFLFCAVSLCAIEKRDRPLSLKTSVIVPCHYSHFPLLENLLICYQNQTVLPDEVVISLSEYEKISEASILGLEKTPWPFSLVILKQKEKCKAGKNRTEAARASTGDLLLCQDADDLPHPQRVEIVKWLFENWQIKHFLHSYIPDDGAFTHYEKGSIPIERLSEEILYNGFQNGDQRIPIHHGNVCLLKELLQRFVWDPHRFVGEDIIFNLRMQIITQASFATPWRLIHFRGSLSYVSNLK